MKKITAILFSLLTFISLSFISCKTETNKNNNQVDDIEITEDDNAMVYPIPTPFEVTQMLEKSGATYVSDLTNSTENSGNYFTEKSKAINLGIYGADLSYSSTFNKPQDTRNILAVSKKLTEDLGITSMFDDALLQRVEKNIENEDSLYKIVSDSYYDTFNQFNKAQKGNIAVMILTGGWIESLYISCELASISNDKSELLKGLAQQRLTSSTLLPLLQNYKENTDINELIDDVKKIKTIYDQLEEIDDEFVMNEEQFNELSKIVDELRNKLIQLT